MILLEIDWVDLLKTFGTPIVFLGIVLYAIRAVAVWFGTQIVPMAQAHLETQAKTHRDTREVVDKFCNTMAAHNDQEMGKLDSIRFDVKEIKAAVQKPEGVRQ